MRNDDLKKLKRAELLELMVAQSKEIDRLREENERLTAQLESKKIAIQKSGSIAEAALALNHIFEDAQRAVDLYMYNVRRSAGPAGTGARRVPTQEARRDSEDVLKL